MGLEPTRSGFTARRSDQLSYSHHHKEDDGRNRTCVSGGCSSAPHRSATSSLANTQHAGLGSNQSLPDLEAGAPPLGLPAYRREQKCAGKESNLRSPVGLPGLQPGAWPLCHLRVIVERNSQRGRIRTSSPVLPKHVRCQIAPHAEKTMLNDEC